MNGPFKVGEICIGQNFVNDTQYNGMECEIIQPLKLRRWRSETTGETGNALCYEVRWADGCETIQEPHELRRKPPKQDLTEWANAKIAQLTKPVEQPVKECA